MPLPEIPELGTPSHILGWLRNETTEDETFTYAGHVFERYVRFLRPGARSALILGNGEGATVCLLPMPRAYRLQGWVVRAMDRMNVLFERRHYLTRDEVLDIILKEVGHAGETQAHPDLQPRGGLAGHA